MSTVTVGLQGVVCIASSGRATWAATPAANIYSGTAPAGLTAMNVVRNVNMTLNANKADVSSRASLWKLTAMALQEASIDIDIPWTPADSGFQALRNAFFNRTSVALAILDGPSATSGSQGLWADFVVTDFPREEPIDKEMLLKVKIEPTASAVPPQWVICN